MAKEEKQVGLVRLLEGLQESIQELETSASKFDAKVYAHGPTVRKGLLDVSKNINEVRREILARMKALLAERGHDPATGKKVDPKKKAAPKVAGKKTAPKAAAKGGKKDAPKKSGGKKK